jgi:pimeloyl-ACP methyl ester carboxylesterase
MPSLQTKLGRLHYEVTGTGPTLLLWHSWLSDGRIWEAQVASLRERYRVIVVDGPCHGRSETPLHPFTLDDCADAAIAVLDAENVAAAVLVGLSWGGMTVMRVALRAPERVLGLVLLGTTADAEPLHHVVACHAFAETVRRVGMLAPLRWMAFTTMFGVTTLVRRRQIVRREGAHLSRLDRHGIRWSTRAIVTERRAIRHALSALRMPTLVAVGAEDRCLPPSHSRRIARAIPGARFVVLPRVGHLVSLEAPERVLSLIEDLAARAFAAPKSGVRTIFEAEEIAGDAEGSTDERQVG